MSQRCASVGVAMICLLCAVWPVKGEQVTITGTVTCPDGAPAAEAQVMTSYGPVPAEITWPWAKTTTDAAGAFTLTFEPERAKKSYAVVATKEGFALAWERVEPGGTVQIQLGTDPAACLGTVRDPEGKPIGGARVRVSGLSVEGEEKKRIGLSTCEPPVQAVSDAVGNFWIPGLPRGAEVWPVTLAEGYAYKWGPDKKPAKVGQAFTITLQPEATVSGRVTHHGKPVAGVCVITLSEMDTANEDALTAADGTYTARSLPAGTFRFTIAASDEWIARGVDGIDLPTGEHKTGVDIEVFKPAIIEGSLREPETGQPVAGAWVHASDRSGPPRTEHMRHATSNAEGHYHIAVFPGRVEVGYGGNLEPYPRERSDPDKLTLTLKEGEVATGADFVLGRAHAVHGIVLGPGGEPAPGVRLWLVNLAWGLPWRREGKWMPPAITDEQGRFDLGYKGYGSIGIPTVFAQDEGHDLAGYVEVKNPAEELTLQLEPGAYLTGQVANMADEPVARIPVWVLYDAEPTPLGVMCQRLPVEAESDDVGLVRIGPLPPGLRLVIELDEATRHMAVNLRDWDRKQLVLKPGETLTLPTLRLNPAGRTLGGTVFDQQVQPVQGATVAAGQGPRYRELKKTDQVVTTGANGRFQLSGLRASGYIHLLAFGPERKRACMLSCDPDTDPEPMLTVAPLSTVGGVVYDAEGQPLGGATVWLNCPAYGFPKETLRDIRLRPNTRTDDRGRYEFGPLIPGIGYALTAEHPKTGVKSHRHTFVAAGGDGPEVIDIYVE